MKHVFWYLGMVFILVGNVDAADETIFDIFPSDSRFEMITAGVYIDFVDIAALEFGVYNYGFEIAYWNMPQMAPEDGIPLGIDFGFEYSPKHSCYRLYSELQPVFYLVSISLGPVVEFGKGSEKNKFGWQATVWGGALALATWKYRLIDTQKYSTLGLMVKFPVNLDLEYITQI